MYLYIISICRFFFDFSATYVGVGMICPYIVNISVLLGGILSWGLMWPLIENRSGDWYSKELSPKSMNGLQGYKVCDLCFLFYYHFCFEQVILVIFKLTYPCTVFNQFIRSSLPLP